MCRQAIVTFDIWVTRRVSYQKQELCNILQHLSSHESESELRIRVERYMSTRGQLFQWVSIILQIQFSVFVQYESNIIIISLNVVYSLHDIAGKQMLILALNNKNAPFKINFMSKRITISRTKYDFLKERKTK